MQPSYDSTTKHPGKSRNVSVMFRVVSQHPPSKYERHLWGVQLQERIIAQKAVFIGVGRQWGMLGALVSTYQGELVERNPYRDDY